MMSFCRSNMRILCSRVFCVSAMQHEEAVTISFRNLAVVEAGRRYLPSHAATLAANQDDGMVEEWSKNLPAARWLEHFNIQIVYADEMLWPCEATRSKAREIGLGGFSPPLRDNLIAKLL